MPVKSTRAAAPAAITEGISPLLSLQNALRYWWILAALTALGALIGWAAHLTRPVLYESIRGLPIGFDYVSTGPMTQFEEDIAMEVVSGLLTAPDVIERTVARLNAVGLDLTPLTMRKMAIVERRLNVWELRIRAENPAAAEQIASTWMEEAHATISESYGHSVLADSLGRYARSLETCLARTAASEPASGLCSATNITNIQEELVKVGGEIVQEREASRGLFVGMRISDPEMIVAAERPIRYGRAGFALGGALIGLLLGIVLVETGVIRRLLGRR